MNLSTNFRGLLLRVEIALSHLKHMYSVSFAFTWKEMLPAACPLEATQKIFKIINISAKDHD